ncbi:nuclear transport factor 2 family protein [Roseomonas sp. CCTCC AB2023176]|uniref:nuclear transport factor 2 family protein n=1 Tax=Roseomonas sp. CCTCC AB2023176 TaxID=3342640 RepID=UPI0035DBBE04
MSEPHAGMPRDAAEDADLTAVRRLIEAWGFRRDAGEWEALADTFHPEGSIAVSWYGPGPFAGFVAACRANRGKTFSKHAMCGSRVTFRGPRAVAETDVLLFMRGAVQGVEVVGQTNMRFLDRIERRGDGAWRILDRTAIYDHDMMAPAISGTALPVAPDALTGLPPGYRFLAWRLRLAGRTVPDDLPTPGSKAEATLRREAAAWLAA